MTASKNPSKYIQPASVSNLALLLACYQAKSPDYFSGVVKLRPSPAGAITRLWGHLGGWLGNRQSPYCG